MIEVPIAHRQQSIAPLDIARLTEAIRRVLAEAGYARGEVSLAIVDDAEMQALNAKWLSHDWPTDVLSFALDWQDDSFEGEIIVSAETAQRQAAQYDWRAADELLLYVIHGALHLIGHDDHDPQDRDAMRRAEQQHLSHFGLSPRYHPCS